jgi:penicillin-binding protein 1A
MRGFYGEITGRSLGGGGTITMQVVRNYVLSFERTYIRKLREIILAWQLEDHLTKQEIFELYFNKAFLGNRNYGFAAAYQYYFGKDFSEASIAESALLAGVLQTPSRVNPVRNPLASKKRRDVILGRMLRNKFITDAEYNSAREVIVTGESFGPKINIEAEYLAEKIRIEVINRFGLKAYEDGMNIYTTLDSRMQQDAVEAVRSNLYKYDRRYGWKNEEVYKDFNFSILRSAFLEEGLFIIPARVNYEDAKDENINKLQNLLSANVEIDGYVPSLVIGISNNSVTALDAKLNIHKVNWNKGDYEWARTLNSDGTRTPKPEGFLDFIELGSLVYISNNQQDNIITQLPSVEGAFVAIDGLTGDLKAYVGGFDFSKSKFDRASNSRLLPGSSIKPFIYGCAFENELNPSSIFIDGPIIFEDSKLEGIWRPRNNSGEFYGPIRLREALIQSLNLVSIKLVQSIGLKDTLNCFKKYNFDEQMLTNDLSIALGTGTINPFKAAQQFSMLVNNGQISKITYIDRIEDINGNIIYDPQKKYSTKYETYSQLSFPWINNEKFDYLDKPLIAVDLEDPIQAMDPRVAFMLSDILKEALQRNITRRQLTSDITNMGGKTGTTNDATSTWFSGYASNIVASAWVGKDDGTSLGDNEFGSTNALPIWLDFMNSSKDKLSNYSIDVPEGVAAIRVNKETGQVSQTFSDSYFEFFLEENVSDLLNSERNRSNLEDIID